MEDSVEEIDEDDELWEYLNEDVTTNLVLPKPAKASYKLKGDTALSEYDFYASQVKRNVKTRTRGQLEDQR